MDDQVLVRVADGVADVHEEPRRVANAQLRARRVAVERLALHAAP